MYHQDRYTMDLQDQSLRALRVPPFVDTPGGELGAGCLEDAHILLLARGPRHGKGGAMPTVFTILMM